LVLTTPAPQFTSPGQQNKKGIAHLTIRVPIF